MAIQMPKTQLNLPEGFCKNCAASDARVAVAVGTASSVSTGMVFISSPPTTIVFANTLACKTSVISHLKWKNGCSILRSIFLPRLCYARPRHGKSYEDPAHHNAARRFRAVWICTKLRYMGGLCY